MKTDFSKKYLESVLACSNFFHKNITNYVFLYEVCRICSVRYKRGQPPPKKFAIWDSAAELKLEPIWSPSYLHQVSYGCKVSVQEDLGQAFWSQQAICNIEVRKGDRNMKIIGAAPIFASLISMCPLTLGCLA